MSATTRAFTFLVNPASGGGAAPGAVVPVARLLRDAGAPVEVTYSPGPAAMRDLVAGALGRGDVVVSVGGDGMLSSLAGAVSRGGGTLALLPAARGNDFARMLGLPDEPDAQARLLLEGEPRVVDLLATSIGARRRASGSSPARSTPASTPTPPRSSTAPTTCRAGSSTPTPRSARWPPTSRAATACRSTASPGSTTRPRSSSPTRRTTARA